MTYRIREVDASDDDIAEIIHDFNRNSDNHFPELTEDELDGHNCFWWLAYCGDEPIGFSGMVPSRLYPAAGYLKRAGVLPEHRGNGIQRKFFGVRERKARKIGWNLIVSETTDNIPSANNFIRCGYEMFEPKEPWSFKNAIYWRKNLG